MPVNRDVNHVRVALENLLRPIPMMPVNIQNQRRFPKRLHSDCDVVQVAEPASRNTQRRTENSSMMSRWTHQRETAYFRSQQRSASRKPRKLVDVVVSRRVRVFNQAFLQVPQVIRRRELSAGHLRLQVRAQETRSPSPENLMRQLDSLWSFNVPCAVARHFSEKTIFVFIAGFAKRFSH